MRAAKLSRHTDVPSGYSTYSVLLVPQSRWEEGSYDTERARLICTSYSLDYSEGPYIVLLTEQPKLPAYFYDSVTNKDKMDLDNITKPVFILKFGGLNFDRSIELMDRLEQQIFSSNIKPSKLRLKQTWLRIEQWC